MPAYPDDCKDNNENCAEWAAQGECTTNRVYMVGNVGGMVGACRLSCKACRPCAKGDRACQDENRVLGGYLPLYSDGDDG